MDNKKSIIIIVIFVCCCCISVISSSGGYFVYNKNDDNDDKLEIIGEYNGAGAGAGSTVNVSDSGSAHLSGGAGTVMVKIESESGDTIQGDPVDPNIISLVQQTGVVKCEKGSTYDIIDDSKMWVDNGCRGLFTYKGKVGQCLSREDGQGNQKVMCPIGSNIVDPDKKLMGLVDPEFEFLKDYSDGKCVNGSYGLVNMKNMYVDKGCKGLFRYGPAFGYCVSHNNQKKVCDIGRTQDDPEYEENDYRPMKKIGLFSRNPKAKSSDAISSCEFGDDDNPNYNIEGDNLAVWGGCGGNFRWSEYKGDCYSGAGKSLCPIGSTVKDSQDRDIGLVIE